MSATPSIPSIRLRRSPWPLALLILFALCVAALARAQPVQLRDDRGRWLSLAQPPQRIVSLLPSLTESVCALDQCQRLVGVDRYSNWPEAALGALPRLGGGLDPGIEAIVALRPDVVLLASSSRASDRLETLGIKVLALEPRTHADVRRVLGVLGELLGVPQDAERLWRVMTLMVAGLPLTLKESGR